MIGKIINFKKIKVQLYYKGKARQVYFCNTFQQRGNSKCFTSSVKVQKKETQHKRTFKHLTLKQDSKTPKEKEIKTAKRLKEL